MGIKLNISLDDDILSRALERNIIINIDSDCADNTELHLVGDIVEREPECLTETLKTKLEIDIPQLYQKDAEFDVAELSPQVREKLRKIAEQLVKAPVVKNSPEKFQTVREGWIDEAEYLTRDTHQHNPVTVTICNGMIKLFNHFNIYYRVIVHRRNTDVNKSYTFDSDGIVDVVIGNNDDDIITLHYKPSTTEFIDDGANPFIKMVIDELLSSSFVTDVENRLKQLNHVPHESYSVGSVTDYKTNGTRQFKFPDDVKQRMFHAFANESIAKIAERHRHRINESFRRFNERRNKSKDVLNDEIEPLTLVEVYTALRKVIREVGVSDEVLGTLEIMSNGQVGDSDAPSRIFSTPTVHMTNLIMDLSTALRALFPHKCYSILTGKPIFRIVIDKGVIVINPL